MPPARLPDRWPPVQQVKLARLAARAWPLSGFPPTTTTICDTWLCPSFAPKHTSQLDCSRIISIIFSWAANSNFLYTTQNINRGSLHFSSTTVTKKCTWQCLNIVLLDVMSSADFTVQHCGDLPYTVCNVSVGAAYVGFACIKSQKVSQSKEQKMNVLAFFVLILSSHTENIHVLE